MHEQGRFNEIGWEYSDIDEKKLTDNELLGAIDFWNGWLDECESGFTERHEKGIKKEMWPTLARYIAERLSKNQKIVDPVLLKNFKFEKKK